MDADAPIPPEREAEVFEEIASDAPAHMFAGLDPDRPAAPKRHAPPSSTRACATASARTSPSASPTSRRLAPAHERRARGARSEVEPVESPDDLLLFFGAPLRDETLRRNACPGVLPRRSRRD